jgi:CubicO group peptidase (beta-lactamase class C family)
VRWVAAIFALLVFGVPAQTIDARLDTLFAPYRENDAPGMVAILIHDGRIVWQTAFGLADLETHRAITPDTQFELASITKQFTAMAVMILSKQARLNSTRRWTNIAPSSRPTRGLSASAICCITFLGCRITKS